MLQTPNTYISSPPLTFARGLWWGSLYFRTNKFKTVFYTSHLTTHFFSLPYFIKMHFHSPKCSAKNLGVNSILPSMPHSQFINKLYWVYLWSIFQIWPHSIMSSAASLVHIVIIPYLDYFNNMPTHLFFAFTLALLQSIFHSTGKMRFQNKCHTKFMLKIL